MCNPGVVHPRQSSSEQAPAGPRHERRALLVVRRVVVRVERLRDAPRGALADQDGRDAGGERSFATGDFSGPCGIVVGGEGKGIRRLVREHCDFIVTIPMGRNEIGSLNASVAAGLVLYEVFRQRHAS